MGFKKCIYYLEEINMCDGFTYVCDCMNSEFCPMYESEETIREREEFFKTLKNNK